MSISKKSGSSWILWLLPVLIVVIGGIIISVMSVKVDILLFYVLTIMLFALIPEILDIILAYHSQNKARRLLLENLIEKASHDELTLNELKEFIAESGKAPPGMPGLTRGLISLTVILILGISTLHILIKGAPPNGSQIISNILSMLAGLLAAITGFYFGGRTAETILTGDSFSTQPQPKSETEESNQSTLKKE